MPASHRECVAGLLEFWWNLLYYDQKYAAFARATQASASGFTVTDSFLLHAAV